MEEHDSPNSPDLDLGCYSASWVTPASFPTTVALQRFVVFPTDTTPFDRTKTVPPRQTPNLQFLVLFPCHSRIISQSKSHDNNSILQPSKATPIEEHFSLSTAVIIQYRNSHQHDIIMSGELQFMEMEESSNSMPMTDADYNDIASSSNTCNMSSSLPINAESAYETIQVMRRQEEMLYTTPDYFNFPSSQVVASSSPPADASCRFFMAQWCYQIVDHCRFKRETAAVAMNYLDRFLASHDGQTRVLPDRQQFQLAAMSCLYTAVKIHEHEAVTPRLIANLSNGVHSTTDVEAMEVRILKALTWAVNPPTSSAFCHQFMERLAPSVLSDLSLRTTAIDLAHFQSELAVCDYSLVTCRASWIALSALLNATESLLDGERYAYLEAVLCQVAGIDMTNALMVQQLQDIRIRLYEAIADESDGSASSGAAALAPSPSASNTEDDNTKLSGYDSPRCIAQQAQ
jgi:Cyclin, N-terminal domain